MFGLLGLESSIDNIRLRNQQVDDKIWISRIKWLPDDARVAAFISKSAEACMKRDQIIHRSEGSDLSI